MGVSASAVKELRDLTGAGMLDCKKALEEAQGDLEQAKDILRQQGIAFAEKRASRETQEGIVHAYLHSNNRLGSLVELNCETDFVARTDVFQELTHHVAMQVAAAAPEYVSPDDMPPDVDGNPEEICLLAQPFIKDPSRTVQDLVNEAIAKTGENIRVRRFVRFQLGQ